MTSGSGPINLNKARKAKARDERRAKADENAAKFGRSKDEKQRDQQGVEKLASFVARHKREE